MTFLSGGVPITSPFNPASLSGSDGSGSIQSGAFRGAQATALLQTTLPVGQDSITAVFSGDNNYAGSTSAPAIVNVQADFSIAAVPPSISISSPGGKGTTTLTITGQTGYNGTVNFSAASCAGLPRESTCSFSPASVTGSGSTTLTVTTTAPHTARLNGVERVDRRFWFHDRCRGPARLRIET